LNELFVVLILESDEGMSYEMCNAKQKTVISCVFSIKNEFTIIKKSDSL